MPRERYRSCTSCRASCKKYPAFPPSRLQPMAGAQGELTSILMVKKFFEDAGDEGRTTVIVPESAARHQPGDGHDGRLQGRRGSALTSTCCVAVEELRDMVDESTAALMITNPEYLRRLRAEHRRDLRSPARSRALSSTWMAPT